MDLITRLMYRFGILHSFFPFGGGGKKTIDTGDIGHSLRFSSAGSTYASRTFGTASNLLIWTHSEFIKRGVLGGNGPYLLEGFGNATNRTAITFTPGDALTIFYQSGGSVIWQITTSQVFRDPTAAFHLVVAFDATNSTASERVKIYINNVRVTSFSTATYPTLNQECYINNTCPHYVGKTGAASGYEFDGYLSRVCFIDGVALDPTSFGYLNTQINKWVSKTQAQVKAVVDAGGANSFMLDFDNGTSLTTLGYDKSSKGNNWTLNNFSLTAGPSYDWMLDVPGNRYAVLNALDKNANITTSNGNLTFASSVNTVSMRSGFLIPSSGKWYWEVVSQGVPVGIVTASAGLGSYVGADAYGWSYDASGVKYTGGSSSAYGASYTTSDTIGVAFDADAGTLTFYKNNVAQGVAYSSLTAATYFPAITANTLAAGSINFGQQPFTYTPPTGFKALCQANLPDNETITTSGTFSGNLSSDGPYVDILGVPLAMTINGNAVTWGVHADACSSGFKVRTASSSYNNTGSNTFSITSTGAKRKYS